MMQNSEFHARRRTYRNAATRRAVTAFGLVLLYTIVAFALFEPLFGFGPSHDAFLLGYLLGPLCVIIWILLTSRRWNEKWGVFCPNCSRSLLDHASFVRFSGHCMHCRSRVIEDIPAPVVGRSVVGRRHLAILMLLTGAVIVLALVPIGDESFVAGHSTLVIAAAVCSLVPLILWRIHYRERLPILMFTGGLVGAVAAQLWRASPLLRDTAGLGEKIEVLVVSVVEGVFLGGFVVMIVWLVLGNILLMRIRSDLRKLRGGNRV